MTPTKVFHSIVCCVAILSSSCNSVQQEKHETGLNKLDTSIKELGKSVSGLKKTIAFLDSNLKYGRLSKEMELKMAQAESDYYRTRNEKYYKLFYKYQKEQWRIAGLANKYYDSLQAQKRAK